MTERVDGTSLIIQLTISTLNDHEGRAINEYLKARLDPSHNQAVTGVALDLSKVELITSAAIGALITVHKKMAASGQKFVLFNLSSMLSQALSFLKLDNLFVICGTTKEAQKALSDR